MKPLELVSLELDEHAERIGEYFKKQLGMPIRRVKFKHPTNYYQKEEICKMVDETLGQGDERKLVLYGDGSCHQFTYGLCKHADRFSEDYGYVHFDHHNDSYGPDSDSVSCGIFVPSILKDTHASRVLFIGAHSEPNPSYFPGETSLRITEEDLREKGGFFRKGAFEKLESGLRSLPEQVYLTFDLDVMDPSLVHTSFAQGTLTLRELMKCIALIKRNKQIIGADVLGFTGKSDQDPGKQVYAEIVDSLLQAYFFA